MSEPPDEPGEPEEPQPPVPPSDSILVTIKKLLGFDDDYKVFDMDIILHINSTFAALQSFGVGPEEGFSIEDDSTNWEDYIVGDNQMNSVKSYMYIRVRLLFDPPETSYARESLRKQADEIEWRLYVHKGGVKAT